MTEDELTTLLDKATPLPWYAEAKYVVGQVPDRRPNGEVIGIFRPTVDCMETPEEENAELCAAAVNALPALIAEIKALREENGRLTQALETSTACLKKSDDRLIEFGARADVLSEAAKKHLMGKAGDAELFDALANWENSNGAG